MESGEIVQFLTVGAITGFLLGWLISWLYLRTKSISRAELEERYVWRELHLQVQAELERTRLDAVEKEEEIRMKREQTIILEQQLMQLEEQNRIQKKEVEELEKRFQVQFENIANRILEEKSRRFTDQNKENIKQVLDPLRERIKGFEEEVRQKYLDESKERASLKTEIGHLVSLNQQLSMEAHNLVNALRGENKIQGNWGELRLEMILEHAGLQPEIHYRKQVSMEDEDGNRKQPDFIIHLPDKKHLIIDSKVSLVAYERFYTSEAEMERDKHLKDHINSIRNHVKSLSGKNYQELNQLHSPDYLLIYIPIEHAYILAIQHDQNLFLEALRKNVVLVTGSTLLATMRTVSFIWNQEKQKANALEIAKQSGLLYEKFVGFVEDLRNLGSRLDQAQGAYSEAMKKMIDSPQKGGTLLGRAQKIKELGARTSKSLPSEMLDRLEENNVMGEDEAP